MVLGLHATPLPEMHTLWGGGTLAVSLRERRAFGDMLPITTTTLYLLEGWIYLSVRLPCTYSSLFGGLISFLSFVIYLSAGFHLPER